MRLIDADALMEELGITNMDCSKCQWGTKYGCCGRGDEFSRACCGIDEAPTVEQPDIVRCTNCRYNDGTAYCELHFRDVEGNDFCSWGEVKE